MLAFRLRSVSRKNLDIDDGVTRETVSAETSVGLEWTECTPDVTFTVTDAFGLPSANLLVTFGGEKKTTDENGQVTFNNIKTSPVIEYEYEIEYIEDTSVQTIYPAPRVINITWEEIQIVNQPYGEIIIPSPSVKSITWQEVIV